MSANISHHIPPEIIAAYAAGSLGQAYALVVAAHVSMCDACRAELAAQEAAGGVVMSDTCPSISRRVPPGTRVIATDSAKQAHYLPAIAKVQGWFGSVEQCVNSAIAGEWLGVVQ